MTITGDLEVWKTVEGFPDYEISPNGELRNKNTSRIKKPSVGKRGYYIFSLQKDHKCYVRTLHILLARTFLPNPLNLPQVNHIDGNKLNCSLSNLEWITAKGNLDHARKTGLHLSDGDKKTYQYSLSGELIKVYKSASEAARINGLNRGNICAVARGNTRLKTYGGYIWKYE